MPRAFTLLAFVLAAAPALADEAPSAERRASLMALLRQDCGACHGMTLKGGLGPPLLPTALAPKSAEELVDTVLDGRPGTPMPPWRPFLSEAEAAWLVENLKSGLMNAP